MFDDIDHHKGVIFLKIIDLDFLLTTEECDVVKGKRPLRD